MKQHVCPKRVGEFFKAPNSVPGSQFGNPGLHKFHWSNRQRFPGHRKDAGYRDCSCHTGISQASVKMQVLILLIRIGHDECCCTLVKKWSLLKFSSGCDVNSLECLDRTVRRNQYNNVSPSFYSLFKHPDFYFFGNLGAKQCHNGMQEPDGFERKGFHGHRERFDNSRHHGADWFPLVNWTCLSSL